MDESRAFEVNRERLAWWGGALIIATAIGYIVTSFLGIFMLGLFAYYAARPIYRRLETKIRRPGLTAIASILGLALPAIVLIAYTLVIAVQQLDELLGTSIDPEVVLGPAAGSLPTTDPGQLLADPAGALGSGVRGFAQEALGSLLIALGLLASGLIGLIIVLVFAYYLLRDDQRIACWFREEILDSDSATLAFFRAVDHDLQVVYFGNILTAFVIAIVATLVFNVLGLVAPTGVEIPSPTLLGLLTGVASLIPVVGMKIVYVPVGLYLAGLALVSSPTLLWFPAVFLVASFVFVDTVPELVLRPYVSGRGLHTGLVMLAYIIGPVLFGWYGLFLGPLILVLVIHFVRIILPELLRGDRLSPNASAINPLAGGAGGPVGITGTAASARKSVGPNTEPDGTNE